MTFRPLTTTRVPDYGRRDVAVVLFGFAVCGLGMIYGGLTDASPALWTYTQEQIDRAAQGRLLVATGALVLAGAAAVIAAAGQGRRALAVVAPGVVCLALALVFRPPGGAWAWLAYVPLAPLALIAALPVRLPPSRAG